MAAAAGTGAGAGAGTVDSTSGAGGAAAAAWCFVGQHNNVALTPGGAALAVTASYASRLRWVSLVVQACIAPYAHAVACMRHGVSSIIPDRAIS
jgi:hypothetical protein